MPEGVLQAAQGKTFTPMHLVLRRVGASLKEGKRCAAWRKGLRAIDFLNGGSDAIHHRIAGRVFGERFGILDDSGIFRGLGLQYGVAHCFFGLLIRTAMLNRSN